MKTAKQIAIELIPALPDDCSMEDIIARLDEIEKIEKGFKSVDEGRFVTTDELKSRINTWLKK